MAKFVITGGKKLSGKIAVSGAKNAILPILAATLLTGEKCRITNVPDILDVKNFVKILIALGAKVETADRALSIQSRQLKTHRPPDNLVSSMRASIVLLGALLGRLGRAEIAYPGGDLIGKRPIDLHLQGFRKLGATVREETTISVSAQKLAGAELFAESSVTGTENLVLAAVLSAGRTVIKLAALEPHVAALCDFLNSMGAKISGVGENILTIEGVKKLHGAETAVIPDMIEAGSFALLAAATRSEMEIVGVAHGHLDAVYHKFDEMGVKFEKRGNSLLILTPKNEYQSAILRTGLYPNLATDLQPPFGVFATQCRGITRIHDWIWEGRLGYLSELKKMGADARIIDTHQAEIKGPTKLAGNTIRSLDIRSGMTLVIAAIVAAGVSEIEGIQHIDRGYEQIDVRLRELGADIKRVN